MRWVYPRHDIASSVQQGSSSMLQPRAWAAYHEQLRALGADHEIGRPLRSSPLHPSEEAII